MTEGKRTVILGVSFAASLLSFVLAGCNNTPPEPRKPHPFVVHAGHAKCSSTPVTIFIEIDASDQVLKHPEDEVILVCPKDLVIWKVADGVTEVGSFTVDFQPKNNSGKLFESNHETLKSAGSPPQTANNETVKGNGSPGPHPHYDKDYVYSIQTFNTSDAPLHKIDPHVIPVGN